MTDLSTATAVPNLVEVGTFMGVPRARGVHAGQVAILGLPFDCGTHPTRIGCRQGPAAFRAASSEVRPFYPPLADVDPRAGDAVVDLGDVRVTSSEVGPSLAAIEAAVAAIAEAGAVPLCVGGDGTTTLPVLRALGRRHPGLVLIHIDAHTDSYPGDGVNTGTTFSRAADEGAVDVGRSFHIGARGTLPIEGAYDYTRSVGFRVVTGADVRRRGLADVLAEVRAAADGRPVHLSFDLDYIDPSAAPGVATPTWGGPSPAEAFDLLHGLDGLDFVGVDINTLSPPHDVAGMTAMLAGHVALIALHLIARGSAARGNRGGPPS